MGRNEPSHVSWLFFETNPSPGQRISTIVKSGRSHTRRFVRQPEKWPHMPVRGAGGWLEAVGLNRHKPWQITFLRSSNVASEHDELAVETFEKPAKTGQNGHFFDAFFRAFQRPCARGAANCPNCDRKTTPVGHYHRVAGH